MKCQACGAKNPANSKFCKECGEKLSQEIPCPQCGQLNKPGTKFCMECGQPLQEKAAKAGKAASPKPGKKLAAEPTSQPATQTVIIRERERRGLPGVVWAILGVLLSVMLCVLLLWFDVVDVPAGLTESLPEPLAQIVDAIEDHNLGGPAAGLAEGQEAADQEDGGALAADACELIKAGDISLVKMPSLREIGWIRINFPTGTKIYTINTPPDGHDLSFRGTGGDQIQITVNRTGELEPGNKLNNIFLNTCIPYGAEGVNVLECVLPEWKGGSPVTEWFVNLKNEEIIACGDLLWRIPGPCAEGSVVPDINVTTFDAGNGGLGITFDKATPFEHEKYQVIICTEEGSDTCWTEENCNRTEANKYVCTVNDFNDPGGDGILDAVWITGGDDCWQGFEDITYAVPAPFFLAPSSPCKAGETYHPEWKYNNGCCTDGCWCKQSGKWGCWTTCAPKCSK